MNELLRQAVEALQSIAASLRLIAYHLGNDRNDADDTADYHLGNRTTDAGGGMQSNDQTRSAAHLGVRGDE